MQSHLHNSTVPVARLYCQYGSSFVQLQLHTCTTTIAHVYNDKCTVVYSHNQCIPEFLNSCFSVSCFPGFLCFWISCFSGFHVFQFSGFPVFLCFNCFRFSCFLVLPVFRFSDCLVFHVCLCFLVCLCSCFRFCDFSCLCFPVVLFSGVHVSCFPVFMCFMLSCFHVSQLSRSLAKSCNHIVGHNCNSYRLCAYF